MTKDTINILALGDVVGMGAVRFLEKRLWNIRREYDISLVIANSENSADGNGVLPVSASALLDSGVDVLTGGNHSFRRREIYNYLDDSKVCIRPANMPSRVPGHGHTVVEADGKRFLVINLLGTMYLDPLESPFATSDRILESEIGKYDYAIVDFHAEATSEKAALARYLDGKISILFGTHTHVATADTRILPCGTGFVTDLGMIGPDDSILGVKSEIVIEKFLTHMPMRFEQSHSDVSGSGVIFTLDKESGKCIKAKRINI